MIKQHRAQAVEVRWPEFALQDLDVPGDLERVGAGQRNDFVVING